MAGVDPLKIVQISTADRGGGAEASAYRLHRRYGELGHQSILAVGARRTDDPDVTVIDNAARARGARSAAAWWTDRLGMQDLWLPGWRTLLQAHRDADVFHIHNMHPAYFDVAGVPALARTAPTIVTLHDMWVLTGHCAHSFGCGRWQTGCGRCPDLTIYPDIPRDGTRFNHWRKRRYIGGADITITAPSRWMADLASRSYLRKKPVHVIANPVDTDTFSPGDRREARASLGLPLDELLLVFPANAGTTNVFKDFGAFRRLIDALADVGAVGVAFADSERSEGRLLLRPRVANEDAMARHYRAADLVVQPTRAETLPLAVLEAGAVGVSVVGSAVGGMPEAVLHEQTGLLVPPGDDAALEAAVRRLLASPDLRQKLGEAARRHVVARYESTAMADEWLRLYEAVGAERARRRTNV